MNDFDFQRPDENNKDIKLPKRCQISQIPKICFYRYHTSMNNNLNQNVFIENKTLLASLEASFF